MKYRLPLYRTLASANNELIKFSLRSRKIFAHRSYAKWITCSSDSSIQLMNFCAVIQVLWPKTSIKHFLFVGYSCKTVLHFLLFVAALNHVMPICGELTWYLRALAYTSGYGTVVLCPHWDNFGPSIIGRWWPVFVEISERQTLWFVRRISQLAGRNVLHFYEKFKYFSPHVGRGVSR